jgi:tRNA A64-2'-O-ribosylphosphate transferase
MVFLEEDLSNVNSIYKVSRKIKRRDQQSLYNSLRSIYEDAKFVGEIRALWPELPLLANLRCGLWYAPFTSFHSTPCYFKSTDGHAANCSFNPNRLNLHVAHLAGMLILYGKKNSKEVRDYRKTV